MSNPEWILYGATGYTGQLLAEEAVKRGHRPLIAGRSPAKLAPLAEKLGLEWAAVELLENIKLAELAGRGKLVFHAAGPYTFTARPMIEACLQAGVHYIDITGEIPVFKQTFSFHEKALERGVCLISGAGFDVVPTDCLGKYVAGQLPDADTLEVAFASKGGGVSAGTAKSSLEMLPNGRLERRDGKLVVRRFGRGARRVRFHDHERTVLPVSWGDVETAYRTTGIPNISAFMAFPSRYLWVVRLFAEPARRLISIRPLRRAAQRLVGAAAGGPSEEQRRTGRALIWARASAPEGRQVEAWLETSDAYTFTARAGVLAVEKLLNGGQSPGQLAGALTPAMAFEENFVLEVEGSRRFDQPE